MARKSVRLKVSKGEITSKKIPCGVPDEVFLDAGTDVTTKIVGDDQFIPKYKTDGAACCDLVANIPADGNGRRSISLGSRSLARIDCGFRMQLPPGYKAEIAVRSSWGSRGLLVVNAPGQIDSDYRGDVQVVVGNIGKEILLIEHGERIAQMWVTPVHRFRFTKVEELDSTARGEGGFGSTGNA